MGFPEYSDYDATGLADLVRNGEVTPAELVDEAIARIEKHDDTLNAVVHRAFEQARSAAASTLPRVAREPRISEWLAGRSGDYEEHTAQLRPWLVGKE